ncbi:MAG: sugar-binding domain-containing protein [Candidatus Aminicenantaceae bacterium]
MRIKSMIGITVFLIFWAATLPPEAAADKGRLDLKEGWMVQSARIVPDSGQNISTENFKPQHWYPTSIPTTVLTALVKNGVYPDPYIGMNNMRIPDASDAHNQEYDLLRFSHLPDKSNPWTTPYWFRKEFRVPSRFQGQVVWLKCDGLNYRADVWLNGRLVASSKKVVGMFGHWVFDVTKFLKSGKKNILAIKVYPLDYPGLPAEPQLKAFGPFGPNGGLTGDIGKNVTMQCSVGWDWIPAVRDRNMGIWQDVYMTVTGPVDIRHPHVITDLPLPDLRKAEIRIDMAVVNLTEQTQQGLLKAEVRPKNFEGRTITLQKRLKLNPHQLLAIPLDPQEYPSLKIQNPKLWWPNNLGEQNLYELVMSFEQGTNTSDVENVTFGIREVSSRISVVDEWVRRDFFINGSKILLKGGAWVPDMMLNRDRQKLYSELRLFQEANLNMVRIWGGGVTPPEDFFVHCDSFGLLVWHDFWITGDCQGTWDKGSKDYPYEAAVFLKNAEDVVKKLRNHPSIMVWTAGNEGHPRKEIYVPLRDEIIAGLDGTRPFLPSSGYSSPPKSWGLSWPDNEASGTYSGGPYFWVDPKTYYDKVNAGRDWLFKNEVGLPSLPKLESLKKFIPDLTPEKDIQFPLNHTWGYHDACEGNGKYSLYDQAIRRRYGEPKNVADYILKGQLVNAENYRAVFEAMNQAMDRTAGVLLWKVNPAWPSVIWQLYDWYLSPNAGYYFVKKACEPLHAQLNLDDYDVSVINNTFTAHKGLRLAARVFAADMEEIWSDSRTIDIEAFTSKDILRIPRSELTGHSVMFVELVLEDKDGKKKSENFYWLAENDEFSSLVSLPRIDLDVDIEREEFENRAFWTIQLTNPSGHLAFFVNVRLCQEMTQEEILPSFWSDNYVSLLPGKIKRLTVEFPASRIKKGGLYIKLDGWNVSQDINVIEDSD